MTKYIYKKDNYYIYKRRIPHSNKFFIFNTKIKNLKKVNKFAIIFNKLTIDIFSYLKNEGKNLTLDFDEVNNILNNYKNKALLEYEELEKTRHEHIGKLFKIEIDDPLIGKTILSGGQPAVIDKALPSFENLAVGDMFKNRTAIKKYGKEIVARSTSEVKSIYSKLRKERDDTDLLYFLSMLFKKEAEILKIDFDRAKNRFSTEQISPSTVIQENNNNSVISHNLISLYDMSDNFLYEACNYDVDKLNDSSLSAYKTNKIVEMFISLVKDIKGCNDISGITVTTINKAFDIIPKIPKRQGNTNESYNFYEYYKTIKVNEDKNNFRGEGTIETDLKALNRLVKYFLKKKYITENEFEECQLKYTNTLANLRTHAAIGKINLKKEGFAFKDTMIKNIFNTKFNIYRIIFEKLGNIKTKDKHVYWGRFYSYLILFFTGARCAEIAHLKTDDCEIINYNGEEKLLIFVEINEVRGLKNKSSKRIMLIHDFLANDLNLINFVKLSKQKNWEYLFNTKQKFDSTISKEFNRNKDFLQDTLDRSDEFYNTRYTLHSFRHTFKSYLLTKNVPIDIINKLQGHKTKEQYFKYVSMTDEVLENMNKYNKYLIVDWGEFINITKDFKL